MGTTIPIYIFFDLYIFFATPVCPSFQKIKDFSSLVPLSFIFTIDFWSHTYYRRSFLEQGRIPPSKREGEANIPQCATVAWLSYTAFKSDSCPRLMTVSPHQETATCLFILASHEFKPIFLCRSRLKTYQFYIMIKILVYGCIKKSYPT